jgi:hypothetical protein
VNDVIDRAGCDELREMASDREGLRVTPGDCERSRVMPGARGRRYLLGLVQFRLFDRSRGSLVFLFHRWSSDCPRAIVFGVIPLIRGNESEACTPVLLTSSDSCPANALILN